MVSQECINWWEKVGARAFIIFIPYHFLSPYKLPSEIITTIPLIKDIVSFIIFFGVSIIIQLVFDSLNRETET